MKRILFVLFIIPHLLNAAAMIAGSVPEENVTLHTKTGDLYGTLSTPETFTVIPVVLIIAGSGSTDRDGNNPMMKNNSLKMLSDELIKNGIATLRYDKRGIAESQGAGKNESDLRFEDYVNDTKEWIQLLKNDKRFSKIIIAGHSEGSLIGMIAAPAADKFISIAGAGQSADKIIKEQLGMQPKQVQDLCFPILDSLKIGKTVDNISPILNSLFRASVQPYMISWFHYDPQAEIKKLVIPVLILQGTQDIQVSVEDARRLARSYPKAESVMIEKMNHIFKIVSNDQQENVATYSNPSLPISDELVRSMVEFIKK